MRKYWKYLVLLVVLLVGGVTAFFVFYHPPMRLMPPPLLLRDGGAEIFGVASDLPEDSRLKVFYATNRLPIGPRDNRVYTVAPDRELHFGEATMRVGSDGTTWDQLYEWSTGTAGDEDRPYIHLENMREAASRMPGEEVAPRLRGWLDQIDAALAQSPNGDILIYVHGANTTVERAAGQASQLRHFSGRNAVTVLFAWPTAENFLRYPRDIQTAFGGAPHLADLIDLLATETDARNIDVFTYSAGGTVGSDALAQLGRERPAIADRLGDVYHAAPDADFRGFASDLADYAPHARRVTTALNMNDSALRLAEIVNRASRAGRPDLRELSPEETELLLEATANDGLDLIQVSPETIPALARNSHTFWYDDPWVSSDVLVTLLFDLAPAERGLDAATSASGARYWHFTPDFPERMPALRDRLRARAAESVPAP